MVLPFPDNAINVFFLHMFFLFGVILFETY